jgi:hypothetical protein
MIFVFEEDPGRGSPIMTPPLHEHEQASKEHEDGREDHHHGVNREWVLCRHVAAYLGVCVK